MATGDAPLLVVVFVVGRIVVPSPPVGLEDRSLSLEGEVEVVGASVPHEWEFAREPLDAVGDEQAACEHFEG